MNLTRYIPSFFLIGLLYTSFSISNGPITGCLLMMAVLMGFNLTSKSQTWQVYAHTKVMLIYLVWLLVVATSSSVVEVSSFMVVALACLPVIYLILTNLTLEKESLQVLRVTFFVVTIGFVFIAFWQVYYHIDKGLANGPLKDRNAFAALLNLIWFPMVYSYIAAGFNVKRWVKPIVGIGLFLVSTGLFATTSRGGLLTWAMLVPFILWASYQYTSSQRQVLNIFLIALLAYFCSSVLLNSNIADRTFEFTQDSSTAARLLLWKSTIQMTIDNPLTGLGWGTFMVYYPAYRSPLEYTTAGQFTHNDYLQLAAEGGVIAFILQFAVLISICVQFKRNLKNPVNSERYESLALLLGVLAIFIQAAVNFIFYFAFMNIIVAVYLARVSQLTETPRYVTIPQLTHVRPFIKRLGLYFVILIFLYPYLLRLFSELSLKGSQPIRQVINWVDPSLTAYDLAVVISAVRPSDSNSQDFLLKTAESLFADKAALAKLEYKQVQDLFEDTMARYELMRIQNANSPNYGLREVKFLVAYYQYSKGDFAHQNVAYKRSLQILDANLKANPFDVDSMIKLSRMHAKVGHIDEAKRTLHVALGRALDRRYQQHIECEILRQQIAPNVIEALEVLDKQIMTEAQYDDKEVDERLKTLSLQIVKKSD